MTFDDPQICVTLRRREAQLVLDALSGLRSHPHVSAERRAYFRGAHMVLSEAFAESDSAMRARSSWWKLLNLFGGAPHGSVRPEVFGVMERVHAAVRIDYASGARD